MNYPLLEKIICPENIKEFSFEELDQLSQEIRQRIINVLAINGGHLASNLGSVELSIALHYVFSSPEDKFIFDVSHQSYPHKLLTGRNQHFDKIRQYKGLCGFTCPKESIHDHFYAGHAGTALSLALGVAKTRDLLEGEEHVIPIIGDATLTCGLAHEALNNIPKSLKRFLVVLNDNAMSISHNVGGVTNILSRMLSNPKTSKWVHELESLVSKIPGYGAQIAKKGHKITESIKNLVSSAPFFEQFGLSYIGPIDGHDIKKMVAVFQALKDAPMPVIIHIFTQKGNGVATAVKDPINYHGAKPFNPDTGQFLPTSDKPTFPKVFGKQILKMAEKDPKIVAVTPAMSLGSCLDPFMQKFPERCIDVGIAEGHAVTFCGGLAHGKKLKIICSIYATFLQRALDNLFHDVCLQELPVVFTIDRAGISGPDGSTHHGIYEIGFLKTMPNLVICQPRNGHILKELMESAFSWQRPTAIRYPNMATEEPDLPIRYRELGTGELLAEGDDVLIIALGHMAQTALLVRDKLRDKDVHAAVLDPIFIKPLDKQLLDKLLAKHRYVVTLEEHSLKGGLASEINSFLIENEYDKKCLNLGMPEFFVEQGSYNELMKDLGLTPDTIAPKIIEHFNLIKEEMSV